VGECGLAVQWRYEDGKMLSLALNLGSQALQMEPQRIDPGQAQPVFSHRCPAGTPPDTLPAWGARWTLGPEATP